MLRKILKFAVIGMVSALFASIEHANAACQVMGGGSDGLTIRAELQKGFRRIGDSKSFGLTFKQDTSVYRLPSFKYAKENRGRGLELGAGYLSEAGVSILVNAGYYDLDREGEINSANQAKSDIWYLKLSGLVFPSMKFFNVISPFLEAGIGVARLKNHITSYDTPTALIAGTRVDADAKVFIVDDLKFYRPIYQLGVGLLFKASDSIMIHGGYKILGIINYNSSKKDKTYADTQTTYNSQAASFISIDGNSKVTEQTVNIGVSFQMGS